MIASLFLYSFQWTDILYILLGNQEGLRWNCFYPMWFLVSILLIRIICSFIKENGYVYLMLIMIAVGFFVWKIAPYDHDYLQVCTTAMCFPFFLMGTILKRFDGFCLLDKIKPFVRYLLMVVFFVFLVQVIRYNGYANIFRCMTGKNALLYYGVGILFSYMALYLISKIFTKSWSVALTISSGTVLILGLHRILLNGIIYTLPKKTIIAVLVALVVMLICWPLIIMAQKYFPAIVGGRGVKEERQVVK